MGGLGECANQPNGSARSRELRYTIAPDGWQFSNWLKPNVRPATVHGPEEAGS